MNINDTQKRIILQVLNCFETGSPEGDYGAITIDDDGPKDKKQITFGRSQTTEFGNLQNLIEMYVAEPDSIYADEFKKFVPKIGKKSLVRNNKFKKLLEASGKDPVMIRVQDQFFDDKYYKPALQWAEDHGFEKALSLLVIYDSFIHSGQIRDDIRQKFSEVPPNKGGEEKVWIAAYTKARHEWLANHKKEILHKTVYRTRDLLREIENKNWDLAILPILANGISVT